MLTEREKCAIDAAQHAWPRVFEHVWKLESSAISPRLEKIGILMILVNVCIPFGVLSYYVPLLCVMEEEDTGIDEIYDMLATRLLRT